MRLLRLAIGFVPVALFPVALAAQTVPSPFRFVETRHTVSTFAGHLQTDTGEQDIGLRPGPLVGARYNIHFTGPLLGTAALSVSSTERTVYQRPSGGADLRALGAANALLMILEAGLRFQITGQRSWRGLTPYVGGTGAMAADLRQSGMDPEGLPSNQRAAFGPTFAASANVGSTYFLTERVSLQVDVRDYLWRINTPAGLTESGSVESEWTQNFSFTFGGAIHF